MLHKLYMAKKDKPEESAEGVTTAAKKIGKASDKSATTGAIPETSGADGQAPQAKQPSSKVAKLEKKNKNRLPRRDKKALQKASNL